MEAGHFFPAYAYPDGHEGEGVVVELLLQGVRVGCLYDVGSAEQRLLLLPSVASMPVQGQPSQCLHWLDTAVGPGDPIATAGSTF